MHARSRRRSACSALIRTAAPDHDCIHPTDRRPHCAAGSPGKFDIGDRVVYNGERAQVRALEGGIAVLEIGGRDGGGIRRAENKSGTLKAFAWRQFDAGADVEFRWDKWADWHPVRSVHARHRLHGVEQPTHLVRGQLSAVWMHTNVRVVTSACTRACHGGASD